MVRIYAFKCDFPFFSVDDTTPVAVVVCLPLRISRVFSRVEVRNPFLTLRL